MEAVLSEDAEDRPPHERHALCRTHSQLAAR